MSGTLTIEERKRMLEERRRALEERKQVVLSLTQVEEEAIKTEEAVDVSAKKRELDERKRMLLEKKNALLAKRQTEDEEIRKQEADELEKKKNLQIEEKKREFEERKRKLEEKKKQLEEQRKKEDEDMRKAEQEEEKKIAAKKQEIEDRRKALEQRKQELAQKRKEEEEKQKLMEQEAATQAAIDLEQKRAELEEKKRRLDEKKKQLEEIRERENRERKEAEELAQKKAELEARKKALELKKKQLEEQRNSISFDKSPIAPQTATPQPAQGSEKPDEIAPTAAQIQNQNQSLAELEAKKRELERRKKELEERRKQQLETPTSPQIPRQDPAPTPASRVNIEDKKGELEEKKRELERRKKELADSRKQAETETTPKEPVQTVQSYSNIEEKKRELEEKKKELEKRKQALAEAKREDEERQQEQKRREQAQEFERRKQELDERRRQMEEKKRALQEEKERAMKEAQQRALEEQEEIARKKQDLEDRRKQIQERKRLLDEIRKKEDEESLREKQQEEELQRKKSELDHKKKLLEEKRKQLEAEKERERKEQEEMEALERKKKELEDRKEKLRQRKKELDETKEKEKAQDQVVVAKPEPLQPPPQLVTPQMVTPSVEVKEPSPSLNQNATPVAPSQEDNEEAVEQEIQRKKAEIEERKKRIEEKKKLLELQRQKEEEEKRQREEEEKRAQEEQEAIQNKRKEIEQKRKELEERKKALEQLKQEEEKKIIVLEGEQQQLAQLEEISAIQLKKAQLEDRKRILEDRKKALEERRQTEKQEQQDIERKAKEEEQRQKQEEDQLEKRRRDLEERRKKLAEKKQQLKELQSAEVAQHSEDVAAPNEDSEKELDVKRQELEERKRKLAERRKQLQELKSLNAATNATETEKEELTMIEQTKAEIENTQNELESKLQTLEAKKTVQLNTNEDMLASLSSKERQLLNMLTPDQQKALEQISPSPNRTKSNTLSKNKKPAESLGYDAKAFAAEQERQRQLEKEQAKKLKKEQKEKEKEREKKEREDKERQRKEQKELEKQKKAQEKLLAKTKPVEAVYVPKTELSEAEKMFLASMTPTDRTSFLAAQAAAAAPPSPQPEKAASQSGGTIGKSMRKKTASKGSFIMPEPSVFVGESTSEFEDLPKLSKQNSFLVEANSSAPGTPGGTIRVPGGVIMPGMQGSLGNLPVASTGTLRSTPLHEAARNGDKELFKNLLQMEDVNVKDTQGQTPLHVAAFKGSFDMVVFIVSEISEVLAGKKVELNIQDNNGWTPLHAAAFNASAKNGTIDHLKTCKFLLEQDGINPHLQSKDSSTAAHFFFRVTCANKPEWEALYMDVIDLMAKKNIDFNIQNNKGETCLHQAAFRGNLEGVEFLVNLTENLTVLSLGLPPPPVEQAKEKEKKESKMPGVFKNLFTAPTQEKKQIQRSPSAMSPLALTIQPSQIRRVNINTQNQVGETAIHCAAKAGHTDIVKFLVANWADINIKSEQGYPKDVAFSFNQSEIAKYLEELSITESQMALTPALWFKIFSYLSGRDLCRCSAVCKYFKRISDNDAVWKELCINRRIASVINPRCKTKQGFSKIWKRDYIMVKNFRLNPERIDKLAKSKHLVKAQAIARGWVARVRYTKLKKMKVHRDQIAKELVDTEQTYVDNLKILVKAFLTPLRNTTAAPAENPIITKQNIKVLFSDIEIIQNTNNNLLQKLRSRLDSWSNAQKLGDIFVSMTDTFKLYTQYINNFDRALLTLEEQMKNPAFAEFIKPREAALKSTINSLMILPIQRIPRYNLLLTELVKNTWPEHVDYANLKTALQKMQSITTLLNEKKREAENKEKITAVQNAIEPSAGLLYTKTRKFVCEGEFIESIAKGQKIPIYIFLFNDMVIFCRPQKKRTIPPKYKLISQEKLFTVDVVEEVSKEAEAAIGSTQLLQSFVLNTMTGEKYITAQKKEIRDSWVNEFKTCISKSKKSRIVGTEAESSEHDLALLEQNINNEDLKPEAKIKILEAALNATRKQLQDEKRMKEQLNLTKQNLEMQVKQAMGMLTKETKDKLDALAEVRVLKEQIVTMQAASPSNPELDAISKMALEGLTEEQKEWLSHLAADEKQDRIDLIRLSSKKDLKKLGASRTKTLRGKEKEEKKKEKEETKKDEKRDSQEKPKTRASMDAVPSPSSSIHLQELVKQGNKSGIQHALSKGNAALNSQDSEGQTALHLAALEGHLEIMRMLLEDTKTDANIQDINGWTPLHTAAHAASKNPTMDSLKICETLLHHANIKADITNNNLNTALHLFVKVPCGSGKSEDYKNLYEEVISLFLEKTDSNIQNQKGETCLHSAVFAANQPVIERLLSGPQKLKRKKSERKFTFSFSSGPQQSLKDAHHGSHAPERRIDLNITSDENETPLAVAAKLGDVTIINSFVKHFADLTTRAKLGTAADIAKFFQHNKAAELIENVIKTEKTKLPPTIWYKIFKYVAGNDTVNKSMQSVHVVCKEWRRISGRVKTEATKSGRDKYRENASAMSSVLSRQRTQTISMNSAVVKPAEPENENWKIVKQNLEMQLKQAVTLLTDETKKRQAAEKKVKELEGELKTAQNSEEKQKLEEQLKKQRLAYDNMQQQFVMNLDKITTLEKQVKQLKAEKLEENTKYEERVYFMEKQAKEKRDEVVKHYETQMRDVARAKSQLEEANKNLKATIKELSAKVQSGGAAPAVPDRPGQKRASQTPDEQDSGSEKDKRLSKTAPVPVPSTPRKPPPAPTPANHVTHQEESSQLSSTAIPSSLVFQAQRQQPQSSPRVIHDFWEGSSKLIVSVDVPGVDLDLLDFHITRFTLVISRKVGVFEEKYFGNKYKPISLQRFEKSSLSQVVKEQIILPCAVLPNKKQAYYFNGTVYLQLEKLSDSTSTIEDSDWQKKPVF